MTLEEICECDAETLRRMTDAELLKHFEQYLIVTRPELAAKQPRKVEQPAIKLDPKKQAALAALAAGGLDLSFMKRKKK